jgi:hypothetical protein
MAGGGDILGNLQAWLLPFISAGIGGVASAVVNMWFNRQTKAAEIRHQEIAFALGLAKLKHEQLVAAQEWSFGTGQPQRMEPFDPLRSAILYLEGLKEYRKTGRWQTPDPRDQSTTLPRH